MTAPPPYAAHSLRRGTPPLLLANDTISPRHRSGVIDSDR